MNNQKIKVKNMVSPSSGKEVANQFIIEVGTRDYFQSYNSIIAYIERDYNKREIVLDEYYWDYSVTTGKYRNQFLRETKKETEKKIKDGTYKLANLN